MIPQRLFSLLTLGALLAASPACAQSVAGLTIAPDTVRGGGSAMGTVKLSAPAPAGGAEVHLRSRTPDVFVRDSVMVPGGQTAAAFVVQTLPRAGTVSASVGALLGDSAQWAQLTVQRGPGTQTRIATFRAATGEWSLRWDDGTAVTNKLGEKGDLPVPAPYYSPTYSAFAEAAVAIFHPSTDPTLRGPCDTGSARWNWRAATRPAAAIGFTPLGIQGDLPVPADYGIGSRRGTQAAVFRPSTAEWIIRQSPLISCSYTNINGRVTVNNGTTTVRFPATPTPGDVPVPAPYFVPGRAQIAVFRPATAEWFLRNDDGSTVRAQWGNSGDIPVPGDYLGLSRAQIAVYRPSSGEWILRNDSGQATRIPFGGPEDRPVPGDYLGIGRSQLALFRPATAEWFILAPDGGEAIRVQFGGVGDQPVPAAYGPPVR